MVGARLCSPFTCRQVLPCRIIYHLVWRRHKGCSKWQPYEMAGLLVAFLLIPPKGTHHFDPHPNHPNDPRVGMARHLRSPPQRSNPPGPAAPPICFHPPASDHVFSSMIWAGGNAMLLLALNGKRLSQHPGPNSQESHTTLRSGCWRVSCGFFEVMAHLAHHPA